MENITLNRTGDRPLTFAGELVTHYDTRIMAGKEHNRWHELAVYRLADGRLVASLGYRTIWDGEVDMDEAQVCSDPEEALEFFKFADSLAGLQGYPPGDHFRDKQARIERDMGARYDAAVSIVMAQFPEIL
jgi:hypothetical protein